MHSDLTPYLQLMAQKNASDLFFTVGAPPNIKIDGETGPLNEPQLTADKVHDLAYSIMNEKQQKEFEATMEMNLAIGLPKIGRYRVNVYRQRGDVAFTLRYITSHIPSLSDLNLPPILRDLIMIPRGLVLVVGATGSGKSTTLAAMIDYRNSVKTGHILTVEEPIEYVHEHKKSIVDQREVGLDP